MRLIHPSKTLLAGRYALVSSLRAAGIGIAAEGERPDTYLLAEGEPVTAPARTVVIGDGGTDGERRMVPAANGNPARISFGHADAAIGNGFVRALVAGPGAPTAADPESLALLALAERVAQADITVLIGGPTGTGKEVLARAIHLGSSRRDGPFVAINCAALPESMLEAMLFGHQKGAFTGASSGGEGFFRAAHGGTILLDEIAEMPLALQAKLLRAIQEREVLPVGATRSIAVDVRIVAAANRDLAAEAEAGRFRTDLYWRLNVLPITLRPLAQRPADLPAILAALMLRHAGDREPFPWPTAAAIARLAAHRWPGNVRELENVVQRALLLRAGERLEAGDLQITPALKSVRAEPVEAPSSLQEKGDPSTSSGRTVVKLSDAARSTETKAIAEALAATGGNRVRAAGLLGISERTLRYRLAGIRAAADNDMMVAA